MERSGFQHLHPPPGGGHTEIPEDPIAQIVLYLLPILGIVFVAEGVIKVGFTVFRKEENAEVWIDMLADSSNGHIILCGLGQVGIRILEELIRMGECVFVLEKDGNSEFIGTARELGAHIVIGDARQEKLIRSLNLPEAKAIIIATNDDLANLEIAMEVQEVAPHVNVVMRFFDQRLATKVKNAMQVDVSLSTSTVAAPIFASAAVDKRVIGAHRISGQLFLIVRIPVWEEHLARTIGHFITATGYLIIALNEKPALTNSVLEPGDTLQILVPAERLRELPR